MAITFQHASASRGSGVLGFVGVPGAGAPKPCCAERRAPSQRGTAPTLCSFTSPTSLRESRAPTMSEHRTFMIYVILQGLPQTQCTNNQVVQWFKSVGCSVHRVMNIVERNQPGFSHKIVVLPLMKAVKALMVIANKLCPWSIRLADGEQTAYNTWLRQQCPSLPSQEDQPESGEQSAHDQNAWTQEEHQRKREETDLRPRAPRTPLPEPMPPQQRGVRIPASHPDAVQRRAAGGVPGGAGGVHGGVPGGGFRSSGGGAPDLPGYTLDQVNLVTDDDDESPPALEWRQDVTRGILQPDNPPRSDPPRGRFLATAALLRLQHQRQREQEQRHPSFPGRSRSPPNRQRCQHGGGAKKG